MIYNFTKEEKNSIISNFGNEYFIRLNDVLEIYSKKWNFNVIELIDEYSVSCVFICNQKEYGKTVFKIGRTKEIFTEINTLLEYNGYKFVSVYFTDIENGVLLEEYVSNKRLREEPDLEKRLSVFINLFTNLHRKPINKTLYPKYSDWVNDITLYIQKQNGNKEFYYFMELANKMCLDTIKRYTNEYLLHGDFHHDNILLYEENKYKIIDPKGVIGDPIFDIPRFILNEFGDEINDDLKNKLEYIFNYIEINLKIPKKIIKDCLFIETAMGNCWSIQDGSKGNIDEIKFIYQLIG